MCHCCAPRNITHFRVQVFTRRPSHKKTDADRSPGEPHHFENETSARARYKRRKNDTKNGRIETFSYAPLLHWGVVDVREVVVHSHTNGNQSRFSTPSAALTAFAWTRRACCRHALCITSQLRRSMAFRRRSMDSQTPSLSPPRFGTRTPQLLKTSVFNTSKCREGIRMQLFFVTVVGGRIGNLYTEAKA